MANLVSFDWAIKRLLRNKADYCIVEGLLTVLLGKQIRINSLLESEGNKETEEDKFNRVDILAEDETGELMIFEIQNNRELDLSCISLLVRVMTMHITALRSLLVCTIRMIF